tara:strand:- start:69 stop:269 length:201 start_codon:yes stop_codon:yes gene_type:complete
VINRTVRHHYRRYRRQQLETYGNSGLHVNGKDQRQFTGGSAEYGYHAQVAYNMAKAHIHFIKGAIK